MCSIDFSIVKKAIYAKTHVRLITNDVTKSFKVFISATISSIFNGVLKKNLKSNNGSPHMVHRCRPNVGTPAPLAPPGRVGTPYAMLSLSKLLRHQDWRLQRNWEVGSNLSIWTHPVAYDVV
jgi:hypothetical protein